MSNRRAVRELLLAISLATAAAVPAVPAAAQDQPEQQDAPIVPPQDAPVVPIAPPESSERVITSLPCLIDSPGRYMLIADVVAVDRPERGADFGIMIRSDDVVVDLGGHALVGADGTSIGISVVPPERRDDCIDVVVRNGSVRNWGGHGLDLRKAPGCRMIDLNVVNNGKPKKLFDGALVGDDAVVSGCTFSANALDGLHTGIGARVSECGSDRNGGSGLVLGTLSSAHDCTALDNTADGLVLEGYGISLRDCSAGGNERNGVRAASSSGLTPAVGAQIRGLTSTSNGYSGVVVDQACLVEDCSLVDNGHGGIEIAGDGNRIDGNHLVRNGIGLIIIGSDNLFVRNTLNGNRRLFDARQDNALANLVTSDKLDAQAQAAAQLNEPPTGNEPQAPKKLGVSAWANIVY